jgi:monoamine oxidase
MPSSPPARVEALVVGAGLAGLAAALALHDAGLEVALLEARDRVGGRVWTLRQPFAVGLYAEAGAEFISPGHRAVRRYLRRFGLTADLRLFGARALFYGGRRGSDLDLEPGIEADEFRLVEALHRLGNEVPSPARPWHAPRAAPLDARSYQAWLDDLKLAPAVRARQETWTTVDYGVEPEHLSLLMVARDEHLVARSGLGPTRCARGGIDQLPKAMAAALAGCVWLGAELLAVEQSEREVVAHYRCGGTESSIAAQRAVLALPLPVLARLPIQPNLPAEHRAALCQVESGPVMKVLLQFRRRFWRLAGVGGLHTDLPIRAAYDATHSQPGERGILTVYTAGRAASELGALDHAQRLELCLEQLERIFPGCAGDFETAVSVVWEHDPFSLGGYSHWAPGQLTRCGPHLARPAGRLHFAGEYADQWQATMNGALESGDRAARAVLRDHSRVLKGS